MSRNELRPAGVCFAATLLCLGALHWGQSQSLNLAAAGPLVFYLPGWAVSRALRADPGGRFESVVLRVALSLAIVIIAGLALHLADSITKPGWLTALGSITLAACAIDLLAILRAPAARLFDPAPLRWPRDRRTAISALIGAAGLAAAAVAVSVFVSLQNQQFHYTQLWIVPRQDNPEDVVIGLRNSESSAQSYAIELHVDRRLVQSWSDVSLPPGKTWKTTFRWTGYGQYPRPVQALREPSANQQAPKTTVSQRVALGATPRVEVLVYRSNNKSVVYRHVWTAQQCDLRDSAQGRPPCEF